MSKCQSRKYQSNSKEFVEEKREIRCRECLARPLKDLLSNTQLDKKKVLAILLWDLMKTNVGEKPDPEILSLGLGRDKEWRFQQIKVLRAVQKSLTIARFNENVYGLSFKDYINLLLDARIIDICILVLQLRIKLPDNETQPEDSEGDVWEAVYYYSISIVGHVLISSYWENSKAKTVIKKLATSEFVDASMAFIKDDKPIDFLTTIITMYIYAHLFEDNPRASQKLYRGGVLPKIGYYCHKDDSAKQLRAWFKAGVRIHEMEALAEHQYGLIPMSGMASFEQGADTFDRAELKLVSTHWADTIQQCGFQCLLHMGLEAAKLRDHIIAEPVTMKSIQKWFRTPILNLESKALMQSCLRVANQLTSHIGFAWKLMDDFKVLRYLEIGVYYPDHQMAFQFMENCSKLCLHGFDLKYKIANSEPIIRAASVHMYSFDEDLRTYSLTLMALCTDIEGGPANILKYFGPSKFLHYPNMFDSKIGIDLKVGDLENRLRKFARRQLDAVLKLYQSNKPPPKDRVRAERLKEEGNLYYKDGKYREAIERYTQGIMCSPATSNETVKSDSISGGKVFKWYHLPSTLFCNRAQCHIHLKQYKEAAFDCDQVLSRCHGVTREHIEVDEVSKVESLHLKAMFRRSKSWYEIGDFFRAALDATLCLIQEPLNETFKIHKEKVLIRIRYTRSVEPFTKCDYCEAGRGEKLKRCGQCTALYCSRKCQEDAWKKRHKDICKEFQEWKADLPNAKSTDSDDSPDKEKENQDSRKSMKKKKMKKKKVKKEGGLLPNGVKEAETLDE